MALAIEFRPTTTERLPIAATELPAGATVTEEDVTWLHASKGIVERVSFPAVLSRAVPAGAPISAADVDPSSVEVPADWLQIELEVPAATQNGATVVAVMSRSVVDLSLIHI